MTLELEGVRKSFGSVHALRRVDLDVKPGEIVAVTGPSGAGKTTTLNAVAGRVVPDEGSVRIGGRDLSRVLPWKRDFALVQEAYALYPHLSVFDNMAFPLRSRSRGRVFSESAINVRITEIAELLEIGHLLGNPIQHLSGGQRQRVALGRALVRDPEAFLLDEPIAHLDAKLRHWLRGGLRRLLTSRGSPTLWATPDGKEALSVADRVVVIIVGETVQFGTPREVFTKPATARVAEIVTEPPINLLPAVIDEDSRVRIEGLADPFPLAFEEGEHAATGPVVLGVRPASLRLGGYGALSSAASVLSREFTTRETVVTAKLGTHKVRVVTDRFTDFRVNEPLTIGWQGATCYVFDKRDKRLLGEARIEGGGA